MGDKRKWMNEKIEKSSSSSRYLFPSIVDINSFIVRFKMITILARSLANERKKKQIYIWKAIQRKGRTHKLKTEN